MTLAATRRSLFAGALSSTVLGSAARSAPAEVKVGLLAPLSGFLAESGPMAVKGAQMIFNEANAAGGIRALGGAKIVLVTADTGSEPRRASQEGRRLITDERVCLVLGPNSSPEAQAFMPIADRYRVGGLGLETTVASATPFFASNGVPAERNGGAYPILFEWLARQGVKLRSAAILFPENEYGQSVSKIINAGLSQSGLQVTDQIPFAPNIQDMTSIVLRARNGAPDAVIAVTYFQHGVLLARARYNLHYEEPLWVGGVYGFSDPKLWRTLGDEVARATLPHSFGEAFSSPDAKLPGFQRVLGEAAKAYPGEVIDQMFISAAQNATLAVLALEKAASTDPAAVNQALRQLELPKGSDAIIMPTIAGDLRFDAHGFIAGTRPIFVQWDEGKMVTVFPEELASRKPELR